MAEYSESRSLAIGSIIDKLMAEGVAALPTQDLQGGDLDSGRYVHQPLVGLHLLCQGVLMDRVGESGPGRVMFVLLCAEENVSSFFLWSINHDFYLENRGLSHLLHTYIPALKLSLWISCLAQEQKDILEYYLKSV